MRCHVVCDSGVTSRNSNEVRLATQRLHPTNSVMGLSPSNVPLALIQDETYLMDGILMTHARESLLLSRSISPDLRMYRWLYCLFLAIDANFRLKLKARGIKDPELGSGLTYFVNTATLQKHLKNCAHQDEVGRTIPSVLTDTHDHDRSRRAGLSSMQ